MTPSALKDCSWSPSSPGASVVGFSGSVKLLLLGVFVVVPFVVVCNPPLFLCLLVGDPLLKRIGPRSPSRSSVFPFRDFP